MRKACTILLSVLCVCISSYGQKPETFFSFGVEWGYSAGVFNAYKFIYYDEYGSLVADQNSGFSFVSNGYILADAGFNLSMKSRISFVSGFEGIARGIREIPLQLRYCHSSNGYNQDGALFFAGGGVGIPLDREVTFPSVCGLAGGGYRLSLGARMSVDLTASLKLTADRPRIVDNSSGRFVPVSSIQRNNVIYVSANIGLGVNF